MAAQAANTNTTANNLQMSFMSPDNNYVTQSHNATVPGLADYGTQARSNDGFNPSVLFLSGPQQSVALETKGSHA
jgi:hypothetical protein